MLTSTGTYISDGMVRHYRDGGNPPVYFALIAIGGGLGLFGSYKMERKWYDENKNVINDKI
jgi:hypothetical protein